MELAQHHGVHDSRPVSALTHSSAADSVQTLGSRPAGHEELGGHFLADVWRELRNGYGPKSSGGSVPTTARSVLRSDSLVSGDLGDEVTGAALQMALLQHSTVTSPVAGAGRAEEVGFSGRSSSAMSALQWRLADIDQASQDDDDAVIESVRTVGSLEESFVHHAFLHSLHPSRRTSKTSLQGGRRASSYLGRPTSGSSMRSARPASASSMRGSARSMHRSDSLVSGDFGELLVSGAVMAALEQHLEPTPPDGEMPSRLTKAEQTASVMGPMVPQLPSVKEWPDFVTEDTEEPLVESVRTVGSAEESIVHHAFLHSLRSTQQEGLWREPSQESLPPSDGLSLQRSDSMDSDIGEELTLGALMHAFDQHTALSSPRDDGEVPPIAAPAWRRLNTLPEEDPAIESVRTVGSAEENFVHHAFLPTRRQPHVAQQRHVSQDSSSAAFPSIARSDSVISGHLGEEVLQSAMRAAYSQWHTPPDSLAQEIQKAVVPAEPVQAAMQTTVLGTQENLDQTSDIGDDVESVVTLASLEELLLDHCLAEEPALSEMAAQPQHSQAPAKQLASKAADAEESESSSQRSVHRSDSYNSGIHEELVTQNVVDAALWALTESSMSARSSLKEDLQAAEEALRDEEQQVAVAEEEEEVAVVDDKEGALPEEAVMEAEKRPEAEDQEVKLQEEEAVIEQLAEESKPEDERGPDDLVDEAKVEDSELPPAEVEEVMPDDAKAKEEQPEVQEEPEEEKPLEEEKVKEEKPEEKLEEETLEEEKPEVEKPLEQEKPEEETLEEEKPEAEKLEEVLEEEKLEEEKPAVELEEEKLVEEDALVKEQEVPVDEAPVEEEKEAAAEQDKQEEAKARYLIGGWTLLHQHRFKAVHKREEEPEEQEQQPEEELAEEAQQVAEGEMQEAAEKKKRQDRGPDVRVDDPARARRDGEEQEARASTGTDELQGEAVMGLVHGLMDEEEYDGDFMSEDQEEKEEEIEDAMEVEVLAEDAQEEREEEQKVGDKPEEERAEVEEAQVSEAPRKAATPEELGQVGVPAPLEDGDKFLVEQADETMGLFPESPVAEAVEVRPAIVASRTGKFVSKPTAKKGALPEEEEEEYDDMFEEDDEEEDEERARFFRKNNKKETLNSQSLKRAQTQKADKLKSDDEALKHRSAREVLAYYSVFGPNEIAKMHGLKSKRQREYDGARPLAVSLPHIPTQRSPQERASMEAKRVTRLTYHRVTGPSPIHAEWFRHEPEKHGDPPERDHMQHFDPLQIERRHARQRDTYYQTLPATASLKDSQRHRGRSSPSGTHDLTKLPSSPSDRKSSSKALMDAAPATPQKQNALEMTALNPSPNASKSCPALARYRVPDDTPRKESGAFAASGSLARPGRTPLGASVPYSAALQLSAKLGQGPLANRKFKPLRGHEVLQMLHAGALPAIIAPPST